MTPRALLLALLSPSTPWLAPLLRVLLVLWVLVERFGGVSRHLRASLDGHPLALLHAPHVITPLTALGLWPLTPTATTILGTVLVGACVCAILGLATRLALVVVAALFVVYYGVVSGWGFFNHTPAIGAQLMVALAVVPGTTAWSLDRLLLTAWRRRRGQPNPWRAGLAPPVPRFGETVLLLVVGSLYLASGIAKLRYGGMDWLDGDVLQFYLSGQASTLNYWLGPLGTDLISSHAYAAQAMPWVRALATSSFACLLMSWAALVVELGAPVFLLAGRRAAFAWCLAAIGFHIAVRIMMGISFAMWIAVDALIAVVIVVQWWLERSRASPSTIEMTTATMTATMTTTTTTSPPVATADDAG